MNTEIHPDFARLVCEFFVLFLNASFSFHRDVLFIESTDEIIDHSVFGLILKLFDVNRVLQMLTIEMNIPSGSRQSFPCIFGKNWTLAELPSNSKMTYYPTRILCHSLALFDQFTNDFLALSGTTDLTQTNGTS